MKQKCKMGCFYVLYNEKGNIIGCYCIEKNPNIEWIEDKEFTYLSSICLHPDYQGKGIGKKLIESSLENSFPKFEIKVLIKAIDEFLILQFSLNSLSNKGSTN